MSLRHAGQFSGGERSRTNVPLGHDSVIDKTAMDKFDDAQENSCEQSVVQVRKATSRSTKVPGLLCSVARKRDFTNFRGRSCGSSVLQTRLPP